jgi:hypothetical protein
MPASLSLPSRRAPALGRRREAGLGALLLAALAGGCGDESKFAPVCPQLSLLRDAADLTRFAGTGGARDASSLVVAASITAVPAKCQSGEPGKVLATLNVEARMQRGPAAQGDVARVPYFVALTEDSRVLSEQDFALVGQFPPNTDRIVMKSDDIEMQLPVTKTKSAAAYHIYVGFRLTPEELAFNRGQAVR